MDLHDIRVDIQQWIAEQGGAFIGVIDAHPGPFLCATAIVGTGAMMWAVLRWKENRRPKDEVEEMRKRLKLDQMYADRFGDALFDMLMADEIDRHEYKRACRRFGIAYRLHDLLTRKNPKRGMKKRVLHNIEVMHRSLPPVPPPIPGPKPGEGVPTVAVVVRTKKVWIAKGKAMLRLKSATT